MIENYLEFMVIRGKRSRKLIESESNIKEHVVPHHQFSGLCDLLDHFCETQRVFKTLHFGLIVFQGHSHLPVFVCFQYL